MDKIQTLREKFGCHNGNLTINKYVPIGKSAWGIKAYVTSFPI